MRKGWSCPPRSTPCFPPLARAAGYARRWGRAACRRGCSPRSARGWGGGLFWIDAGTGFDAYGLGRAARAAGVDPKEALARVRLARPFNAFQLETILREKLPALWRGEPVVLSDPLVPFIDEDLPQEDYRRLLPRVLGALERLPALWLLLAVRRPEPAGRAGTLAAFLRRARSVAVLEETDEGRRLVAR